MRIHLVIQYILFERPNPLTTSTILHEHHPYNKKIVIG